MLLLAESCPPYYKPYLHLSQSRPFYVLTPQPVHSWVLGAQLPHLYNKSPAAHHCSTQREHEAPRSLQHTYSYLLFSMILYPLCIVSHILGTAAALLRGNERHWPHAGHMLSSQRCTHPYSYIIPYLHNHLVTPYPNHRSSTHACPPQKHPHYLQYSRTNGRTPIVY